MCVACWVFARLCPGFSVHSQLTVPSSLRRCRLAHFLLGLPHSHFPRPRCACLILLARPGTWALASVASRRSPGASPHTASGSSFSGGLKSQWRFSELLCVHLSHLVFCTLLLSVTLADFVWVLSSLLCSSVCHRLRNPSVELLTLALLSVFWDVLFGLLKDSSVILCHVMFPGDTLELLLF